MLVALSISDACPFGFSLPVRFQKHPIYQRTFCDILSGESVHWYDVFHAKVSCTQHMPPVPQISLINGMLLKANRQRKPNGASIRYGKVLPTLPEYRKNP